MTKLFFCMIMLDYMLSTASVKKYLKTLKWEVLPAYSPDIAPSDYQLFRSMTHGLSEQHFTSYEDKTKIVSIIG